MLSLYIFLLSMFFFFYIHWDNVLGILNGFKTNKHLNPMQIHLVVQIRLHILATSLFFKDYHVFCVGRQFLWDGKIRLVAQLDHLIAQKNHQLLKPPNIWCEVCIQTQGGFSRWWFICATTTRWSDCKIEFSHFW